MSVGYFCQTGEKELELNKSDMEFMSLIQNNEFLISKELLKELKSIRNKLVKLHKYSSVYYSKNIEINEEIRDNQMITSKMFIGENKEIINSLNPIIKIMKDDLDSK